MFPVIAKFGPLTLHSYGLLMAIGFGAAIWLAMRRSRPHGVAPEQVLDMSLWVIVGAIAGSRLLYVVLNWHEFADDPLRVVKPPYSGLVWYGGVLAAVPITYLFLRRRGWNAWRIADLAAPSIALGHAIGRIGCLLHGCCFGSPTELPWGITFPADSLATDVHGGRALHPVQVYETAGNLALAAFLVWFTARRSFEGQVFWLYVAVEAALRFSLEFLRGDDRGSLGSAAFSPSQTIAALGAAFAVYMLWRLSRAVPRASPAG